MKPDIKLEMPQGQELFRVGIVSDTHDLLRPAAAETLRTCGCILHGGDVSGEKTLNALREIAPVYAVRGNNDRGPWAGQLPERLRITVAGVRFYMIHNKKDLPEGLGKADADVILYGHSHRYFCQEKDGVLWLNPGSCGRRRFGLPITMAVMEICGDGFKVEALQFAQEK